MHAVRVVLVFAACARPSAPQGSAAGADEIHAAAIIVDGHSDTPQEILMKGFDLGAHHVDPVQYDLDRAEAGNLGAQFFSVYVPAEEKGGYWRYAQKIVEAVKAQAAKHPARMQIAWSSTDVRAARAAKPKRLAAMFGLEGLHALEGKVERVRELRDMGVRYLGLCTNDSNEFADCVTSSAYHGGLSPLGEQAIALASRSGMVVDVSHSADATIDDVLRVTHGPVIASHSGARALANHPRNLTDAHLRGVAATGGVVMVIFYSPFVEERYHEVFMAQKPARDAALDVALAKHEGVWSAGFMDDEAAVLREWLGRIAPPSVDRLLDQIDHVVKVAGIDHVGLGSDYDGVFAFPAGLESVAGIPRITSGLVGRGYTRDQIHKILGGNLLRVLDACDAIAARSEP